VTIKEFIDHHYDHLSVNMESDVVMEFMTSQQLISQDAMMASSSDYQMNCLLLERMRQMNVQQHQALCELLVTSDCQKRLGELLKEG